MDKHEEQRIGLLIKSLAELKRTIKPGVEFVATYHSKHPEIVGLTREVVSARTNSFYSVIKDQPNHKYSAANYGKGFCTYYEKAGFYRFEGSKITVLDSRANDGSVLYEIEVLAPVNTLSNKESENKTQMNDWQRLTRMAKTYKEMYPPGTRIELIAMDDPYAPIPSGTRGTVVHVDDASTIHMKWDNGRTLGVVPGEDSFRKLTAEELAEEQAEKEGVDEDESPKMTM